VIVVALLALFAVTEPVIASPSANRWAEPVRGILAQHCGRCHLPNLPTSVPRALAVFDLTDTPWYGRLEHDQFDDLMRRLDAIKSLPEEDRAIVLSFVRCARDRDCPPVDR
jgi:mono/diheme cytochrome c family protein